MKTGGSTHPEPSRKQQGIGKRFVIWLGRTFRLLLGAAVLAGSAAVSYYWLTNQPRAQRRPAASQAALVEVARVQMGTEQVVVRAMGTVVPAKQMRLTSLVSGRVVEVDPEFIPGGRFRANQTILQIEPDDYRLAVEQQESNLVKAEAALRLERGQQDVAQREYELIGQPVDEEDQELLLRQPQLASSEAAVTGARAALEKARLDLRRTTIPAPFNAVIQSRSVDMGSYVGPGTVLATLVGTDAFWIETSVGVDELRWINIPEQQGEPGSPARIYHAAAWGPEAYREGQVIRLLPELDEGRMARVLVAVTDPLQLDSNAEDEQPLILGSFVRVEILGKQVANVAKIARTAVREGSRVWVMNPDHTLDIRELEIAWTGYDYILASGGLNDGDLLVVSSLTAAAPGMLLRTADESKHEPDAMRDEQQQKPPQDRQ